MESAIYIPGHEIPVQLPSYMKSKFLQWDFKTKHNQNSVRYHNNLHDPDLHMGSFQKQEQKAEWPQESIMTYISVALGGPIDRQKYDRVDSMINT